MNIELTAQRSDSAHETPIVFRIAKPLLFTSEDARIDFQAEVWCAEADIVRNARALREFCERIGSADTKDEVRVTFGLAQGKSSLDVHPGECTLEFSAKPSKPVMVCVRLTSLPPGMNTVDLLDSCVLHFQTEVHCIEGFVSQLEQSPDSPWSASLSGFEPGF